MGERPKARLIYSLFHSQDYPFNVYMNAKNLRVRDGKLRIKPVTLESVYGADYVRQSLDLTQRCVVHSDFEKNHSQGSSLETINDQIDYFNNNSSK